MPEILTTPHGAMYVEFQADTDPNSNKGFILQYTVIQGSKTLFSLLLTHSCKTLQFKPQNAGSSLLTSMGVPQKHATLFKCAGNYGSCVSVPMSSSDIIYQVSSPGYPLEHAR